MTKTTAKFPLTWRHDGDGWLLLAGRRRFGRVVPDSSPGMWRSTKSRGALSDMANLGWAKNAVLVSAELELDFEHRPRHAIDPPKCPQKRGSFEGKSSVVRQIKPGAPS